MGLKSIEAAALSTFALANILSPSATVKAQESVQNEPVRPFIAASFDCDPTHPNFAIEGGNFKNDLGPKSKGIALMVGDRTDWDGLHVIDFAIPGKSFKFIHGDKISSINQEGHDFVAKIDHNLVFVLKPAESPDTIYDYINAQIDLTNCPTDHQTTHVEIDTFRTYSQVGGNIDSQFLPDNQVNLITEDQSSTVSTSSEASVGSDNISWKHQPIGQISAKGITTGICSPGQASNIIDGPEFGKKELQCSDELIASPYPTDHLAAQEVKSTLEKYFNKNNDHDFWKALNSLTSSTDEEVGQVLTKQYQKINQTTGQLPLTGNLENLGLSPNEYSYYLRLPVNETRTAQMILYYYNRIDRQDIDFNVDGSGQFNNFSNYSFTQDQLYNVMSKVYSKVPTGQWSLYPDDQSQVPASAQEMTNQLFTKSAPIRVLQYSSYFNGQFHITDSPLLQKHS